jgi:hypothetical protein
MIPCNTLFDLARYFFGPLYTESQWMEVWVFWHSLTGVEKEYYMDVELQEDSDD